MIFSLFSLGYFFLFITTLISGIFISKIVSVELKTVSHYLHLFWHTLFPLVLIFFFLEIAEVAFSLFSILFFSFFFVFNVLLSLEVRFSLFLLGFLVFISQSVLFTSLFLLLCICASTLIFIKKNMLFSKATTSALLFFMSGWLLAFFFAFIFR